MKKFLKIFCMIATILTVLIFSMVYAAEAQVQINGKLVEFTDVNPQVINNYTMVPFAKIFDELECPYEWDPVNRSVTATKGNLKIVLQIGNNIVTKTENGIEEKIDLGVAVPVIRNNRTLVPLRFIAETLDKQVGWDNDFRTAIIIDYDYFANLINQKNSALYNILNSNGNMTFNVTRAYSDLDNGANNVATLKGNVVQNGNSSNVTLNFEGNNELIKEINSEGWGTLNYEAMYTKENMAVKLSNQTIAKLLNVNTNEFTTFEYKKLDLTGDGKDNLASAIRSMFNLDEKKLKVSTFNKLETEFNKILNLFVLNGTRTLNYDNAKLSTFDYTRFDSVIYGNEMSRTMSFINKIIFNYDFVQDEILYDWNKISYTMNCENKVMVLKLVLENEYNERVNYTINCEAK